MRETRSKRWRARRPRPPSGCRIIPASPFPKPSQPRELAAGDVVRVAAGAAFPADGEVIDGRSSVEEAVLTGESRPRGKAPGDGVLAGSLNRESPLIVRVTAAGEATTLAAVVRLVERAANARPRVARVADRVAAWFVGALLAVAAGSAFVWLQHRSRARARRRFCGAGGLLPLRAVARDARRACRRRRSAGQAEDSRRASRCAGDARARHARRVRQDRDADDRKAPGDAHRHDGDAQRARMPGAGGGARAGFGASDRRGAARNVGTGSRRARRHRGRRLRRRRRRGRRPAIARVVPNGWARCTACRCRRQCRGRRTGRRTSRSPTPTAGSRCFSFGDALRPGAAALVARLEGLGISRVAAVRR